MMERQAASITPEPMKWFLARNPDPRVSTGLVRISPVKGVLASESPSLVLSAFEAHRKKLGLLQACHHSHRRRLL